MSNRNCRRSDEERIIHNEAVRLRRMTDAQLVETARRAQRPAAGDDKLRTLLTALSAGECKGVKGATAYKIEQFAQEKGLL